ncbi:MAG: site-specific DNA-methyltransferase, partial [Sulfuritalea sp.]|nr:site-specific DNA-methyltransferase [Sulfuritalea sp.]
MPLLDWLHKNQAVTAASGVPYRLLNVESTHGQIDAGAADNWLIQGDNLEALKALLPFYAGRVKCIFIDPPYNTKSAFEHYDDNLEHSQWLSMMYPRLELLRELLAENGSIWVSIDDNEAHYLKVMMDEVFGRGNFLTSFIWKKSYGGGAKSKWFVGLHEHVLCYAKNLERFPDMFLPPDPEAVRKYYKYSDEKVATRGPYRLQPLATTSMDERPNLRYAIPLPNGGEVWPEKQWQWSKDRVLQALAENGLAITEKNGKVTVSYKQYLRDTDGEERKRKPTTLIEGHYTQHGTYESMALFGLGEKFSFPKPEGLIQTVLEAATNPNDLVLDSFLGSGTTAAVAHKMGRRWIGIEMGEHARTHCLPRLQKVVDGEQGGISQAVGWQGGGGFRLFTLGQPVFLADGGINPEIRFATLAAWVWYQETRTPWKVGARGTAKAASAAIMGTPILGIHEGTAHALLYNGILGDRRPAGGNVLTGAVLDALKALLPD